MPVAQSLLQSIAVSIRIAMASNLVAMASNLSAQIQDKFHQGLEKEALSQPTELHEESAGCLVGPRDAVLVGKLAPRAL